MPLGNRSLSTLPIIQSHSREGKDISMFCFSIHWPTLTLFPVTAALTKSSFLMVPLKSMLLTYNKNPMTAHQTYVMENILFWPLWGCHGGHLSALSNCILSRGKKWPHYELNILNKPQWRAAGSDLGWIVVPDPNRVGPWTPPIFGPASSPGPRVPHWVCCDLHDCWFHDEIGYFFALVENSTCSPLCYWLCLPKNRAMTISRY